MISTLSFSFKYSLEMIISLVLFLVNECTNVENLSCPASVDGSDFFANNIGTWKCAATMIAGAIPLASMVNTLVISRDLK